MTYIKESIIIKLQKLYTLPRNLRAGNKSPVIFWKKNSCMDDLSPVQKIFIERPESYQKLWDHFHFTGKNRGAAHSTLLNLMYYMKSL